MVFITFLLTHKLTVTSRKKENKKKKRPEETTMNRVPISPRILNKDLLYNSQTSRSEVLKLDKEKQKSYINGPRNKYMMVK